MSIVSLVEKMLKKELFFKFYLVKIEKIILNILKKPQKNNLTYDILDDDNIKKIRIQCLKLKQYNMKKGIIWQAVIGSYFGFKDLGTGKDKSGLDIISEKQKIIIELKNRTNTDNKSSRESNLRRLAKYKKNHNDFFCIYGCINESSEKRTKNGNIAEFIVPYKKNTYKIYKYTGRKLIDLVFGKRTDFIIAFVKDIITKNSDL